MAQYGSATGWTLTASLAVLLAGCSAQIGLRLESPSSVRSLRPTLAWESFSRAQKRIGNPGGAGPIEEVTYDLRILRRRDRKVVYERRGIMTAKHTVEQPLERGQVYVWTVRPRFKVNGHPRVGEWSEVVWRPRKRSGLVPRPHGDYASFRTPRY